jgi:hypothetical protein
MNEWDERYAATDDAVWSGRANGVLVAELTGQHPGRGRSLWIGSALTCRNGVCTGRL